MHQLEATATCLESGGLRKLRLGRCGWHRLPGRRRGKHV